MMLNRLTKLRKHGAKDPQVTDIDQPHKLVMAEANSNFDATSPKEGVKHQSTVLGDTNIPQEVVYSAKREKRQAVGKKR